jgi:iron complex outermembrane receptor protein
MSATSRFLCLGFVSVAALSEGTFAQNVASAPSGDTGVLQEIVVTAQRRVENLQDVPIAATALDASALESKRVMQLADLQSAAPSLSITNAGQTQSVNIRGIGLASNSPNATAGVATYVDGLFQPPIVQFNSFYDLRSIEVLRGPQGTLVGTNSTGGAIFINSNNPNVDRYEGYAQLGFGNFDAIEAEGALNLPLAETFAVRLAGFHRQRDSFYDDVGPFHNKAGELDETGGRIGILWKPGSFSALAKVQLNDQETGGYAYRPIRGTTFESYRAGDIRTLAYDVDTSHRERALIAGLTLEQEFDNGIILRSLSGYQHKRIYSVDDIDGTTADVGVGGDLWWDYFASEKQYSQEINVISPTEGAIDWILGAYYQYNDIDVQIRETQGGFPQDILPKNKRDTFGLFAQVNVQLTDAVELQVGARYSRYEVEGGGAVLIGAGIPGFPPGGLEVADLSGKYSEDQGTGKIALNWKVNDDNLLYAFAARGYKPGGFNSVDSHFDPEIVMNYELGWKSTLLNGQLRTQVALFYNDYSDFQFDVLEPATGQGGIRNVANGTIQGVEAQLQGQFGGFAFDAAIAYVDSDLDGFTFVNGRLLPAGNLGPQCPAGTPSNPPVCFDYGPFLVTTTGGPNLYSPEWTYNLGAEYTFELGNDLTLTPRVNYAYMGSRYSYIAYSPVSDRLESNGLVSAVVTLRAGNWSVDAYGTNLADKEYVAGHASASLNEFYGAPREYGLRVGYTF